MNANLFRWLSLCLVVSMIFAASPIPSTAQQPLQVAGWIKVLVKADDIGSLSEVREGGGEFVEDYDAFSLWRVPEPLAQTLADRPGVNLAYDFDQVFLRDGSIDTHPGAPEPAVPASLRQVRASGDQFWMVQFIGPIKDTWLRNLEKTGLRVVIYMPENTYVVWGDRAALGRLDQLAESAEYIQWTGPYHPAYRLAPDLKALIDEPSSAAVEVSVQFLTTGTLKQSIQDIEGLGAVLLSPAWEILSFTNLTLQVPQDHLAGLANRADIFNVELYRAPILFDEAQGQIMAGNITTSGGNVVPDGPGYLAWLASNGFPTTPSSYPVVSVVDDGIDIGSNIPVHPDFYELGSTNNSDRLIFNANCTADPLPNGVAGHGNLNLGIVGGYNNGTGYPNEDANLYNYGLGISPYSRLAGTKIFNNAGNYDDSACGNTDAGVVLLSYTMGADLTSNSWGAPVGGAYDISSQAYDALTRDAAGSSVAGNQEMLHVFSAGNSGSGGNTIGSPGTAKNVLTVGATENVRDDGVTDGCNYSGANNADDIATFSSRGPTDDLRVKPDIMAPGTHVQGPASQDPAYDGSGACGPSGGGLYYPVSPDQTLYTWSSGTSHSAPAVAGAASLVWEYYERVLNPGETPSPAMLKALMLNTPRYLNGSGTGGTLPSNNQGWGDVDLGALVDSTSRILLDQTTLFSATGNTHPINGTVVSASAPFHVTLVWTDPPGPITGNAYINNLNLEVTVGGNTYRGNVFSGANSATGGTADARNNVENVFIPAGVSGAFSVQVIAANIAGDGVPGNGDTTDQDFALVIYNGAVTPEFTITSSPAEQTLCAPDNAVVNLSLGSVLGFNSPVNLSLSGTPAGTTTSFSLNPVTPPGASVLTIGNTAAGTPGSYTVRVTGTSGALTHFTETDLTLYPGTPAAPAPAFPLSGSRGVILTPTFTWAPVPGGGTYSIQVAADPGFINIVAAASGLTGTSFAPGTALLMNTLYYWRVWATSPCGTGAYSVVSAFVTAANTTPLTVCATPGAPIPDGSALGVTSSLVTTEVGNIFDLNLSVQAAHSWVGDLVFTLQNQGTGTSVTLIDRPGVPASTFGCDRNDINTTLDDEAASPVENQCRAQTPTIFGTFSPNNPLDAFDGQALANTWRMTASDRVVGDTGTLDQWCLLATRSVPVGPVVYAHPSDATCGGSAPCYSGLSAVQSALNAVDNGGRVVALGSHTTNTGLTCIGSVTLEGAPGASLTWTGGAGSLLTAYDCSLTVKGLGLNGGAAATIFNQVGSGSVTAYANNVNNYSAAASGVGPFQIGHNFWGTQDPAASVPAGMPGGQWAQRMGAPLDGWTEGSGSATLGGASLSGGTGTAVIATLGRAALPADAPFGNGVTGHVDQMCSEFYDFFTIGGGGAWSLSLPVDNTTACNNNTLVPNRLYRIDALGECTPSTNTSCWDPVAGASHSGQNLTLAGLSVADLGGTHFVAGDAQGQNPTVVKITGVAAAQRIPWEWVVLSLALAAGFVLLQKRPGS